MTPGSSTASSKTSNPNALTRSTKAISASLKGDVQIHVEAPRRFIFLSSKSRFVAEPYQLTAERKELR